MLQHGYAGSLDDCKQVKQYLAQSFAFYLGQEYKEVWEPIYEDISPNWGFSFGIRSASVLGGPLEMEWYAVISHGRNATDAYLLLFVNDQRVTSFADYGEVLTFKFDRLTTELEFGKLAVG